MCAAPPDLGAKKVTTMRKSAVALMALTAICWGFSQAPRSPDSSSAAPRLIEPEELAGIIRSAQGSKPLILHVGYRFLYSQAHIPQAEYIGPASQPDGIQRLRKRVEAVPHSQFIVLYCGCCPWDACPNVHPAYKELRAMGFTNVAILHLAHNLHTDWVEKGYPVAKGM